VRPLTRLLLSLGIAAVLLGALFYSWDLSLEKFLQTWKVLPASAYFQALIVHAGIYVLRATRFRLLLPAASRPTLPAVLAVSSAHNLAAYVLPAKTGEATLVLYLRKVCDVAASEGLASLVVSRLLDLATLCLLLAVATLTLAVGGELPRSWSAPLGLGLAVGAGTLFVLSARSDWLVVLFTRTMRVLGLHSTRFGKGVEERAEKVAQALRAAGGGGRLIGAALLSLPLWLGVFTFFLVLARGFGLGDEFLGVEGVFGSAWAVLANILPINGFAGAGTTELGWGVGFQAVGVEESLALSTGLSVHIVQLGNVIMMGLAGHLVMGPMMRASRR